LLPLEEALFHPAPFSDKVLTTGGLARANLPAIAVPIFETAKKFGRAGDSHKNGKIFDISDDARLVVRLRLAVHPSDDR
jgi:hypothetical protein